MAAEQYDELQTYSIDELSRIPAVIKDMIFFAEEKWKIASDKGGSGNTANIGSVRRIADIVNGNGVFAVAGEEYFDDYWINYGKLKVKGKNGKHKTLSSFEEYLRYRRLPFRLNNKEKDHDKPKRKKGKNK